MSQRPRAPEDRFPDHLPAEFDDKTGTLRCELYVRLPRGRRGVVVITFEDSDNPKISAWEIARERT